MRGRRSTLGHNILIKMPKAQDKSASAAKANTQPDQASNITAGGGTGSPGISMDTAGVLKAIEDLKSDLKGDSAKLKQDIGQLGQEINGKLDNIANDVQFLSQRMDEAEARVNQVEGWAEEATEALCACLEQQRKLQIKVLDLESRSRRNNLRVFGVPEGQEGDSVTQFIEKLLQSQLQLPEDFNLKIQRALLQVNPRLEHHRGL